MNAMTLEQVVMYAWHDMPLRGWLTATAFGLLIAGLGVILDGRADIRATSTRSTAYSVNADGRRVETETVAFGIGYESARRTVRLGIIITASAAAGLISALSGL